MMNNILSILTLSTGLLIAAAMLWFVLVSRQEGEPRAARRGLLLAGLAPLPFLAAGLLGWTALSVVLLAASGLALLLLLLPIRPALPHLPDTPRSRFDERDIMFARNALQPGTERFDRYYARHPAKKAPDDKWRRRPGLLHEGALYYDRISAAATEASFKTVAAFHRLLDQPAPARSPLPVQPDRASELIKQWGKKLGAVSVGVTELRDYHLYSHVGRGPDYGQPVTLAHRYAIALTVEMNKDSMDRAPRGPAAMESAQQYLQAGAIAVQLAEFIRELGYPARAHIDGNYRVICPLVARDAGLGEVGRMGLLMTPELGPRVRLAVVTSDLPLTPDERQPDLTTLDFCARCKKCAEVCPSRSISFDDRERIDGAWRWRIDSESCFTYWTTVGTDCGRCMSVCPYSHPDNGLHNLVRAGIGHSAIFRGLALPLDDFFYGRNPAPLPPQDWLNLNEPPQDGDDEL